MKKRWLPGWMQSSAGQHEVQSGRDGQPEALPGRAKWLKAGAAFGAGQHGCQPLLLPQRTLGSRTGLMSPSALRKVVRKASKAKPL